MKTLINWHNYKEDKPKKDGVYLTLFGYPSFSEAVEHSGYIYVLRYSTEHDLWNVHQNENGEISIESAFTGEDCMCWASVDDIEEEKDE